jgi:hypothetical protein
MPTLPVVVSTKRFEVPTSRFELTKRLSPLFATMLEVVIVPVILRLDSEPAGGSMAPVVNVVPAAITILELMVTGEAPMMLDAVKVPVIQESPTTCRGFSGSVVPMPTLEVFEMTKVFWSPTLDVFWGAVMKK